jgi:hypothetical protein
MSNGLSTFGSAEEQRDGSLNRVKLGRFRTKNRFEEQENAIFIPLIGISDVLTSPEQFSLKAHHYAQVVIDPDRSDARFDARFLNSDLGRNLRESAEAEGTMPKLHARFLEDLPIFVPDLANQQNMLENRDKDSFGGECIARAAE